MEEDGIAIQKAA